MRNRWWLMIVFLILALALVEGATCPPEFNVDIGERWLYQCLENGQFKSCVKDTGVVNPEIYLLSNIKNQENLLITKCGGSAYRGTTAAASAAGTTAQPTVQPTIQFTAQPTSTGTYTSSLPLAQGCQFGNKCKEFDEVWKILMDKGIIMVEQSKVGMIWDPPTNTWKSFAETYIPKTITATGAGTGTVATGEAGKLKLTREQIDWVFKYAPQEGMDPYLILAIIGPESRSNPWAISFGNCAGLMQICQESAPADIIRVQCHQTKDEEPKQCSEKTCKLSDNKKYYWCENCKVGDTDCSMDQRFSPEQNIWAGIRVLRNKFISLDRMCASDADNDKCAIAAYNSGEAVIIAAVKKVKTEGKIPTWDNVYGALTVELFKANGYDSFSLSISDKIKNLGPYVNKIYNNYLAYKGKSPDQLIEVGSSTNPALGDGKTTFSFAVISDTNRGYCTAEQGSGVAAAIAKIKEFNLGELKPDFVIHVGDMIAGGKDRCTDEEYSKMWSKYEEGVYLPLANAGISIFPVKGNHDTKGYDSFWENHPSKANFVDFEHYPNYYSFNYGNWRFIILPYDGTDLSSDTEQWLKDQVNSAEKEGRPAIIFSHVPPIRIAAKYNDAHWYSSELFDFLRGKAPLIISGHHQAYYKTNVEEILVVTAGGLSDLHNWYDLNNCVTGDEDSCKNPPQTFLMVKIDNDMLTQVYALNGDHQFNSVYEDNQIPANVGEYPRSALYSATS